ncbi:MAG: response regulator [Clostridiaceae bacterium]
MYKLIIADDEPVHRSGLANMIRMLRDNYEVMEACNGEEALLLMKDNQVDIIITDIQMPVMDGLQLIERLEPKVRNIKVVILSVYGYFEYAQKAIRLGALDYILKPVDEGKVDEVLKKVEAIIERERQEKNQPEDRIDDTPQSYLEYLLNKWMTGTADASEISRIEKQFKMQSYGITVVIAIEDCPAQDDSCRSNLPCIKKLIISFFKNQGQNIVFPLENNDDLIVAILASDNRLSHEDAVKIAGDCRTAVQLKYDVGIWIGIGDKFSNTSDGAGISLRQALTALTFKFYTECGSIVCYKDIKNSLNNGSIKLSEYEDKIADAVRRQDQVNVLMYTDLMLKKLIEGSRIPPQQLKEITIYTIMNIAGRLQYMLPEIQNKEIITQARDKINNSQFFSVYLRNTKDILLSMMNALKSFREGRNEFVMGKCLEYINTHYAENISLESIAEVFYFNPSYFSSLFKSCNGINFSQYLMEVRMKKAREMLENTNIKVYKVASGVGYEDSKYFTRVFKKELGISPDEYRRIISGMNKKG